MIMICYYYYHFFHCITNYYSNDWIQTRHSFNPDFTSLKHRSSEADFAPVSRTISGNPFFICFLPPLAEGSCWNTRYVKYFQEKGQNLPQCLNQHITHYTPSSTTRNENDSTTTANKKMKKHGALTNNPDIIFLVKLLCSHSLKWH